MINKCDNFEDDFVGSPSGSGTKGNLKSLNKGSFAKSNSNFVERISNLKDLADFYQICRFSNGDGQPKKVLQITNIDANLASEFSKNCENIAKKVSIEIPDFKVGHSYGELTASCNDVPMSLEDLKSKDAAYYETLAKNTAQESNVIYCDSKEGCEIIECAADGCTDGQIALLVGADSPAEL